jgi:hypothetical protein
MASDPVREALAKEVSDRCRGGISVGTLRNRRTTRVDSDSVRIESKILYPAAALDAWDEKNTVHFSTSTRLYMNEGDAAH